MYFFCSSVMNALCEVSVPLFCLLNSSEVADLEEREGQIVDPILFKVVFTV